MRLERKGLPKPDWAMGTCERMGWLHESTWSVLMRQFGVQILSDLSKLTRAEVMNGYGIGKTRMAHMEILLEAAGLSFDGADAGQAAPIAEPDPSPEPEPPKEPEPSLGDVIAAMRDQEQALQAACAAIRETTRAVDRSGEAAARAIVTVGLLFHVRNVRDAQDQAPVLADVARILARELRR